jgi:dihydroorotate dehydrogenase (fumarate)
MSDLSTTYMGLSLKNPLVPSASPLSQGLDTIKKMAEFGAGAVILYSLFQEQIEEEAVLLNDVIEGIKYRYAESLDFYPPLENYRADGEEYLELISRAKDAVDIPIIGSLNCFGPGDWVHYASCFEEAGADAIELNLYHLPTSVHLTGAQVEEEYLTILQDVKREVEIPVALKLSPFFSSIPHMAGRLDSAGADALVLFNRFYQPDLDVENLETKRRLVLSTSEEMRLPLRWIAILYGHIEASLALTTGVHTPEDIVKAIMAGADIAQVCSVLLESGVEKIETLLEGLDVWMTEHEYASIAQMRGVLSHRKTPNPAAFERANYVRLVGSIYE